MLPSARLPTHPGEILLKEFLEPGNIPLASLASSICLPVSSLRELVRGRRDLTLPIASLLGMAFSTTPEFWANLQEHYDRARSRQHTEPIAISRKL